MEKILFKTGEAVVVLLSILFLGNLIPTTVSMCIAICTKETFEGIITSSVVYWLFTIIGWIVAAIYINDEITKD